MKYEVPIVVDSDSHICFRVGHVEGALEMLEEIGFPRSSSSTAAWRVWTLTSRAAAWICSAAKNKRGTYADRY
ncbi:MAG: hypothetical protein ACLR4Z_03090 [Butyricicoccaceae bacterium]